MRSRRWRGRREIGSRIARRRSRSRPKVKQSISGVFSSLQKLVDVYTFSELVANLIKILVGKEGLLAPFPDPLSICFDVMKRENGGHIFPFAMVGSDSSAPLLNGKGNHLADHAKSLAFGLRFDRAGRFGLGITNAIEPVPDSGSDG